MAFVTPARLFGPACSTRSLGSELVVAALDIS
jgi:hypothetical protein